MRPFSYQRQAGLTTASRTDATGTSSFLAGGTTLVDLMKLDVMRPDRVVDINDLRKRPEFGTIEMTRTGLRLGALVHMSDAASNPEIQRNYPVIADTLNLAASQQIRNMASLGGNVLQRTRCPYFRDTSWRQCNKREQGSGCAALDGFNRLHAVLGASDNCIATYHGDFAQALMALDAEVIITGAKGDRTIKFSDLHVLPTRNAAIEHVLASGDIIQAFTIPTGAWTRRSVYIKVRDRESYEFGMASAAVALELNGDTVTQVRIALGSVATVPWRAREAEAKLVGQPLNEQTAQAAADTAFARAQGRGHNDFKIPLGKATVVRALLHAKAMEV